MLLIKHKRCYPDATILRMNAQETLNRYRNIGKPEGYTPLVPTYAPDIKRQFNAIKRPEKWRRIYRKQVEKANAEARV